MPQKNVVKRYFPQGFYHVYNRGVLKQALFRDTTDYWMFRKILRNKMKRLNNHITIDCFSLMPNHFHLLLYQRYDRDMEHFMRSTMTSFAMYITRKHSITGSIFSSTYKAVYLKTKQDIIRTRKYIFANPIEAGLESWKHVGRKM